MRADQNINLSNYESWIIDYYDGNLDAAAEQALMQFLDAHQQIREEFEMLAPEKIEADEISFTGKAALKRGEITLENLDHYLVQSLENDISKADAVKLLQFMTRHPEYQQHQVLISKTRLEPETVIFTGKKTLKQPVPLYNAFTGYRNLAVAAMLTIFFLSAGYLFLIRSNELPSTQTAQQTPAVDDRKSTNVEELPVVQSQTASIETTPANQSTKGHQSTITGSESEPIEPPVQLAAAHNQTPAVQQNLSDAQHQTIEPIAATPVISNSTELQPVALNENPLAANLPIANNTVSTAGVMDVIKEKANDELHKISGTTAQQQLAAIDEDETVKPRLLGMISKGINKIAGDKVKSNPTYDVDGDLMAYNLEVGKISIQKK